MNARIRTDILIIYVNRFLDRIRSNVDKIKARSGLRVAKILQDYQGILIDLKKAHVLYVCINQLLRPIRSLHLRIPRPLLHIELSKVIITDNDLHQILVHDIAIASLARSIIIRDLQEDDVLLFRNRIQGVAVGTVPGIMISVRRKIRTRIAVLMDPASLKHTLCGRLTIICQHAIIQAI